MQSSLYYRYTINHLIFYNNTYCNIYLSSYKHTVHTFVYTTTIITKLHSFLLLIFYFLFILFLLIILNFTN